MERRATQWKAVTCISGTSWCTVVRRSNIAMQCKVTSAVECSAMQYGTKESGALRCGAQRAAKSRQITPLFSVRGSYSAMQWFDNSAPLSSSLSSLSSSLSSFCASLLCAPRALSLPTPLSHLPSLLQSFHLSPAHTFKCATNQLTDTASHALCWSASTAYVGFLWVIRVQQ
jgi:hypothetical protein